MSNEEQWKPVVGFEDTYEVSDFGRVRRSANGQGTHVGRVVNPVPDSDGYLIYNFKTNGVQKHYKGHRLVLDAFRGPQPTLFGLHADDDPANNALSNLRWGTRAENIADAKRNGRRSGVPYQSHCKRGHQMSGDNVGWREPSPGYRRRVCKACKRHLYHQKKVQ